jgi:penicillin amidase
MGPWRWTFAILGLLILIVAGAGGYVFYRFDSAQTREEGAVTVSGVSAPVKIIRDGYGVPHIFGATDDDVYFGLGYAQAQDRFFQMDLTRRVVEGRLSELLGDKGVALDARARTRNWNKVIAAQVEAMSPEMKRMAVAYVGGVNARLAEGAAPGEYALLFAKPEPWRIEDSVACGMALVADQTFGLGFELDRVALGDRLDEARKDAFLTPYPFWAPTIIGGDNGGPGIDGDEAHPGSNSWALSGARTKSGKPLLANDPHVSLRAPSMFYLAHLRLKAGDVAGASLPGAPIVVLGRGPHAAWAITNGEIDGEDYVPYDAKEAANFPVRLETIKVRGEADLKLFVRDAPEGPIVDPRYFPDTALYGADRRAALRSVAMDLANQPLQAILTLQNAKTGADAVVAARQLRAPILSILLATESGDISYALSGDLPDRDATRKWIGLLPEATRPQLVNPASGELVAANNKPAASEKLEGSFFAWRAARIGQILKDRKFDAAGFGAMQADVQSLPAQHFLPAIRAATPTTQEGRKVRHELAIWDGVMSADRREPLLYAAWLRAAQKRVYADEIGADLFAGRFSSMRFTFMDSVFNGDAGAWCDNVSTQRVESCAEVVAQALDDVGAAPPAEANWGEAHRAIFANPLFSSLPLIGKYYTVEEPVGGDGSTILAVHFNGAGDFTSDFGPGFRGVYDLADLNRSRFMIAPGQSENIRSPHYRDLAALWAKGEGVEIAGDWSPEKPPAGAKILTLSPK